MWDLVARWLPFYRPVSLCGSYDFMTKKLMGASFVRAKPEPVHTKTKRQRKKKPVFSFFFDTGITDGSFYKIKDGLLTKQGRRKVQGRRYFPEALQGAQE